MIFTTPDLLERWLASPDDSGLEFKKGRRGYEIDKLAAQCVALANGGGGRLILGVTDKRPREIVGTAAVEDPAGAQDEIFARICQRVLIEEVRTPFGRVVVVHVPSRLPGSAWNDDGRYLQQTEDGVAPIPTDALRALLLDEIPDFSARICPGATIADLSLEAIATFRARVARAEADDRILDRSDEELLAKADLLVDGNVTFAALILLGSRAALLRWLPQAEVVVERRASDASGPPVERAEHREGLLAWLATAGFDEPDAREAVLNAVAHRDYTSGSSVMVRHYPDRLDVTSPGGLPRGVTAETIADRHIPRNRRILEALRHAGLAERSGQGANLLVERAIRQGRRLPDFTAHEQEVQVTLYATVEQPALVAYFETARDTLSTWDHLALYHIHRGDTLPDAAQERVQALVEAGAVEPADGARGLRFLLARGVAALRGGGGPTRKPTLRHDAYRDVLLQAVLEQGEAGAPMARLRLVIPEISSKSVLRLLGELRAKGLIELRGQRRAARWYAASSAPTEG